jgi:limonene 1,2-monooxygenase
MANAWSIMEDRAAEFGTTVDRDGWRLVGPMHIAATREQAKQDVMFGLEQWIDYFANVGALPIAPQGIEADKIVDLLIESGFAVIGTPDDAASQIERMEKQAGGFGCYLFMAHEWADREATKKSYELFAQYVMPQFNKEADATQRSRDWAAENRPKFITRVGEAIMKSIGDHAAEQQSKQTT